MDCYVQRIHVHMCDYIRFYKRMYRKNVCDYILRHMLVFLVFALFFLKKSILEKY